MQKPNSNMSNNDKDRILKMSDKYKLMIDEASTVSDDTMKLIDATFLSETMSYRLGNFGTPNNSPGGSGGMGGGRLYANTGANITRPYDPRRDRFGGMVAYKVYTMASANLAFVAVQDQTNLEWTVFADSNKGFWGIKNENIDTGYIHKYGVPVTDWEVGSALFPQLDSQYFVPFVDQVKASQLDSMGNEIISLDSVDGTNYPMYGTSGSSTNQNIGRNILGLDNTTV